jgi:hypothetical protein
MDTILTRADKGRPLGPATKQLAGIINLNENISPKELLADALTEKYLSAEIKNRRPV